MNVRVFDLNKKYWMQHFAITESGDVLEGIPYEYGQPGVESYGNSSRATRIVQYGSGVKDINGREIFEGDILQDGSGDEYEIVLEDASFKRKYKGWPKNVPLPPLNFYDVKLTRDKIVSNIWKRQGLLK